VLEFCQKYDISLHILHLGTAPNRAAQPPSSTGILTSVRWVQMPPADGDVHAPIAPCLCTAVVERYRLPAQRQHVCGQAYRFVSVYTTSVHVHLCTCSCALCVFMQVFCMCVNEWV